MNNYWKVFVSCIINNKGEFLALKRRSKGYYAKAYDFPGGKMEFGESIVEAMKREVFEETGIVIDESNLKLKAGIDWKDEFEKETRYAVCFCFVYDIDEKVDVKLSDEHSSFKWAKKEDTCFDDFILNILTQCDF